ncbi:5'-nucleotidase C-terminal domain-containing protein [Clostridium sp. M62/1]|uniref:5'-nucleotidase C-terminal domain-containing protein n=1 Tax=Clostridium sp. M62/1 TaxID=411486 RepID=UPI0001973648|nr:5'-nucleotidase C-terminal domain-containing protein [Clostridium sp. M62/1]EFE11226.1 5'-nucleotidase, C-terminal domain protein [Clostridium sp. M62/1]UEB80271.1 5'-nucleotidase C-terminal domain-containing protein [Clostridium sp. M62/1]
MMMKKFLSAALILCMPLSMTVSAQTAGNQEDGDAVQEVIIYHTNDTHGYLNGDGEEIVGIALAAGLKESTPNSILVDAGDATQGLPLASLTKGADVIELMNLAGYDLMTPGNHEFDFGTETFLSNAQKADFPVLAANIYRNGSPLLKDVQEDSSGCHAVLEQNGVRIGFFGLTTADTASSTNPAGIKDLEFRDEIETAKTEINHLKEEGADVIVAMCHMGNMDASCTSADLADAMTGEYQDKIDVIIDGHSHTVENEETNGILIVQTGSGMAGIGKLTLEVRGDEVSASEELLGPADLADIVPDAAVAERLKQIESSQSDLLGETVSTTETTLWAGQVGVVALTRLVETNYGDFTADAFRSAAETYLQTLGTDTDLPVIAVENGGGIRAMSPNGDITMGDLISAFPFSNTIYLKKVTPAILYEVMEVSGTALDGQDKETGMLLQQTNSGGFLQISGFTTVFNPDGEEGQKVVSITLDGQTEPLDREDTTTEIMMASNNYIMSGGNDYTMLADLPKYGEAGGELETVQTYLESCMKDGVLQGYAGTGNRIQMRGDGYEPKDYTASVLIADQSGEPLAGQELSYRVDGGQRQNGITDENGILQITLSDGAHGVRLADTQQEIYVDNYSGFGITVDEFREQPVLTFLSDGSCDPVDEERGESTESQSSEETESAEAADSTAPAAQPENSFPVVPVTVVVIAAAAAAAVWKKRQNKK